MCIVATITLFSISSTPFPTCKSMSTVTYMGCGLPLKAATAMAPLPVDGSGESFSSWAFAHAWVTIVTMAPVSNMMASLEYLGVLGAPAAT